MLRTFKAVLKGNHLEWLEEAPEQAMPVNVHVIIVESESSKDLIKSNKRRLEALEKLAANNAFAGVYPVEWQREVRRDRPLPGRSE
ncbi:MAG: hypothetical protein GDA56_31260 [Hormoscilla sp. GM7CHS1pb]|nr:hypothetical protein [Hormoscilla sp. GM7CHS1pb]